MMFQQPFSSELWSDFYYIIVQAVLTYYVKKIGIFFSSIKLISNFPFIKYGKLGKHVVSSFQPSSLLYIFFMFEELVVCCTFIDRRKFLSFE